MAQQRKRSSSNPNQKRTTSNRRRTPATRSTSSVITNTFSKGMNKDIAPSLEPAQYWWHARNLANNSEDGDLGIVGNEPSNLLSVNLPYTVIGAIHRYGDEWIIYTTDDINSEIGRFDDSQSTYTTIVNDPSLNFSRKHLITGAAKENFDCTWQVYWDDGLNPSRSLNIDDVPYKQVQVTGPNIDGDSCSTFVNIEPLQLDVEEIRLQPILDTPCVKLNKATDGGQLRNGAYQAYIAYVLNEQRVTDYIGISNIQTLWADAGSSGSLDISVSNLDEDYEYFELVILRRNQGQTSAKKIGYYSTQTQSINIDVIDPTLEPVSSVNLTLRSPAYDKSESMFVVNDYLLRQGPVEQFDFNYQPLANNIKVKWVSNAVDSGYYYNGGNKFNFLRDEQYAFFIRFIYNTGERSSSYHIPGRAPRNFNAGGNIRLENEVIYGDNVLDPSGDKLYKVYNTASITQTLNELQADASIITAKGDMGYWESSEKYPTNRPDIWGDLCGKFIRHHKMPTEELGPALHLTSTNGDLINILGIQFENIQRPIDNDGNVIENIVGYEFLKGSRLGNKSILAKGIFRNMRKYEVPDSEDLLGGGVQGLYPNYPYNDLRPDIYFHDGNNAGALRRTNGCDNLTQSLGDFKALGDGPDVDGEPRGYSRKVFTFHSPELMFTEPFLNAYETRLYGQLSGKQTGYFKPSEDHPQFKLLRGGAALIASILGLGYALHQIRGTKTTQSKSAYGQFDSTGAVGALVGVSSGVTTTPGFLPGYLTAAALPAGTNVAASIAVDILYDALGAVDDLYTGGTGNYVIEKLQQTTGALVGAFPGMVGGQITNVRNMDTTASNVPLLARMVTALVTSQANIAIGGNEIIELMYNLVNDSDFAWKYNSKGFFSDFSSQTSGLFRIKNSDSRYIGSSFQLFQKGEFKINNLFRPETVVVGLDRSIKDPDVEDKSRFVVGGEMNMFLNPQGEFLDTVVQEFSDNYLIDPRSPKGSNISAHYGALKYNFDNQYGQIAGIKQIQMRGCIELIDPSNPSTFLYTSKPIFAGDTFVCRFTEKTIMPIFTDYLLGQPDGFTYDYSLYVNIPYPRFWLNSQKFDMSPLAAEIATLGFASQSQVDALYPNDLYYLDRGDDSCSTNLGQIFGNSSDPNPAFAMEFAYMYTHSNGILDFYVETELNLTQREYEEEPARQIYAPYSNNDIDALFNSKIEKKGNFYKYDESLSPSKFPSQLQSFGEVQPLDYDPYIAAKCFVSYPKRLIYSLRANQEIKKDYWRVFLSNNYEDFKNEVSVIKPVNATGAVIFFPNLSPQLFSGVDTLTTQLDKKITIGDGGLFKQPRQNIANADISTEYGSCESLRGVINTAAGLFFISQAQGKIFQYTPGRGLAPISNAGMKWWFAKYLPSRFIKQFPESEDSVWSDNPVTGVGCQVMYDSVDDVVYFMKKDYQLKPEFIGDATFTDALVKPVAIKLATGITINIDIGDPVYFNDCSWTCSYDPKSKAWISFHDWHPELALPSINHFFTTKTIPNETPVCPPGYNYNETTGLCERFINVTELANVDVTNVVADVTGGGNSCKVDLVIAMDTSGSTTPNNNQPFPNDPTAPGSAALAQRTWLQSFLASNPVQSAMQADLMQIGFVTWAGTVNQRAWNEQNTPGYESPVSMSTDQNNIAANADAFLLANWFNGGTRGQQGLEAGVTLAQDAAGSQLASQYPARSNDPNYRRIILLVADTPIPIAAVDDNQQPNPGGLPYQSPTVNPNATGPANQFIYTLYCNTAAWPPNFTGFFPTNPNAQDSQDGLNRVTATTGPCTIPPFTDGFVTDSFQFAISAIIGATYPVTTWDVVANAIAGDICGTPTTCTCPPGTTMVFRNSTTNLYTDETGDCDPNNPPQCRAVTCTCPTANFPGAVVTPSGDCPDTAPLIYQIGDPSFIQSNPRQCNFFLEEATEPSRENGSIWRHNYRCDSFANFYNISYPWEIDIISNTGQNVNTIRSFEYQLETYVYKGDPEYNMCGGDKWEDLEFNFDNAIVYNNDQVSGLLVLNTQPNEDPWGELSYPEVTANNIQILSSKVEHKFRFNQFWDVTNDRGEFTNAEQSIFDTECNGYIRPLNLININYNKPKLQRKKFRHYSNNVILRRNISGNRKMLLRLNNTKLLLSKR